MHGERSCSPLHVSAVLALSSLPCTLRVDFTLFPSTFATSLCFLILVLKLTGFFFLICFNFFFNSFFKIVILLCVDRRLILLLWSLFWVLLSLDGSPRLQRSRACAARLCTAIVLARGSLEHGSCLPLRCTNAHVPSSQWIFFHVPPFSHWGPGTLLLPSTCSMLFHSSCLPATITKTPNVVVRSSGKVSLYSTEPSFLSICCASVAALNRTSVLISLPSQHNVQSAAMSYRLILIV